MATEILIIDDNPDIRNIINDLICIIHFFKCFRNFNFDIIISITPKAGFLTSLVSRIVPNTLHFHVYTGQVWANKVGFEKFLLKSIDESNSL